MAELAANKRSHSEVLVKSAPIQALSSKEIWSVWSEPTQDVSSTEGYGFVPTDLLKTAGKQPRETHKQRHLNNQAVAQQANGTRVPAMRSSKIVSSENGDAWKTQLLGSTRRQTQVCTFSLCPQLFQRLKQEHGFWGGCIRKTRKHRFALELQVSLFPRHGAGWAEPAPPDPPPGGRRGRTAGHFAQYPD